MLEKYPRISHFPFSPGATGNDRINDGYWSALKGELLIYTEKLDGENTDLNRHGVFARSHSAPTHSPWTDYLKPKWATIAGDLGDLHVFGENLYAVHSIEYTELEHYFYVFGVRDKNQWLSWEEVNFYAQLFDFPVVPVVASNILPESMGIRQFERSVAEYATKPSGLGGEREGLVVRVEREFNNSEFENFILKWVRDNHVQTDEHWTRNWRRAKLKYEQ